MNVSLTPELEKYIEKKVKSGMYQTSSEVVREALRLLKLNELNEAERRRKLEDLRKAVQLGIDEFERGEGIVLDDAVFRGVSERGRKKLAALKQGEGENAKADNLAARAQGPR
jgi:antitoxin ParD1/3/4